jgi:hypothetical protein
MKNKFYYKFVINIVISSYVIFWIFNQFLKFPFIVSEINLFQNISEISIKEDWSLWDFFWIIGFQLSMNVVMILSYCYIIVPLFILTFYRNFYKKYENDRIQLNKIHLFQILITILIYYLFSYK